MRMPLLTLYYHLAKSNTVCGAPQAEARRLDQKMRTFASYTTAKRKRSYEKIRLQGQTSAVSP
jgi:hypothetical protein